VKKILVLVIIFVFCVANPSFAVEENPNEDLLLKQGAQIFEERCMICHGVNGDGDGLLADSLNPKPRVFTDPLEMVDVNWGRMWHAIEDGRPGTAMPSFREALTNKEKEAVLTYVKSFLGGEEQYEINLCLTCQITFYTDELELVIKVQEKEGKESDWLEVKKEQSKITMGIGEEFQLMMHSLMKEKNSNTIRYFALATDKNGKVLASYTIRVHSNLVGTYNMESKYSFLPLS